VRVLGPVWYSLIVSRFSTMWMSFGSLIRRPGVRQEVRRRRKRRERRIVDY
jgi:heme exporter protein D